MAARELALCTVFCILTIRNCPANWHCSDTDMNRYYSMGVPKCCKKVLVLEYKIGIKD